MCVCVCVCVCVRARLQVHYKKKYEQTKAEFHLVVDTAEQRHHKDNALLLSQVPGDDAGSVCRRDDPQSQPVCVCVRW